MNRPPARVTILPGRRPAAGREGAARMARFYGLGITGVALLVLSLVFDGVLDGALGGAPGGVLDG